MKDAIPSEEIDPRIREIGPKPSKTGVPSGDLIARVLDAVSNLLFIDNIDDILEEIANIMRELFPIKQVIIWIADKTGETRRPRIIQGYTEDEKIALSSLVYSREEVDRVRDIANKIGKISYFVPAELIWQFELIDERDSLFRIDMEAAKKPREENDSWHELDFMNIGIFARNGKYRGAIEIEDTNDGKIPSLETIKAMEIFASLSAAAIELAELKEKELTIAEAAEKRSAMISRILSFVKDIIEIKNPEKMFDRVLLTLEELFSFMSSSIVLYDERENCFRYVAMRGYTPEVIQFSKGRRMPGGTMVTDKSPEYMIAHDAYFIPGEELPDDWLLYEIQHEGEFEIMKKQRDTPRKHPRAWHPLDNLLFVIRDRRGRVMGFFYPDNPSDGLIPSPETVESIGIYSSLVSIALENSRSYAETVRAREEIELLNRVLFNDMTNMNAALQRNLERSIARTTTKQKRMRNLEIALSQLNSGLDLIQKVRKLSGIRSRERSSLLRLDLVDAIRGQVDRTIEKFPKRYVKVKYEDLPKECYIFANDLIGELFENLIINAIEHNHWDEVKISIMIHLIHDEFSNRDFWKVSIADNGPGIPEERKRSVFDIGSDSGRLSEKTGLGLSIVSSLMTLYGGTIQVEDRIEGDPAQGSKFVMILPAA